MHTFLEAGMGDLDTSSGICAAPIYECQFVSMGLKIILHWILGL